MGARATKRTREKLTDRPGVNASISRLSRQSRPELALRAVAAKPTSATMAPILSLGVERVYPWMAAGCSKRELQKPSLATKCRPCYK